MSEDMRCWLSFSYKQPIRMREHRNVIATNGLTAFAQGIKPANLQAFISGSLIPAGNKRIAHIDRSILFR